MRRKKTKSKVLPKILLAVVILLVGVLGFSTYMFLSTYIPQLKEQERFSELRDLIGEDEYDDDVIDPASADSAASVKKSKYAKLFQMNEDMRGWLKVDDTLIDYPVMKSEFENGEYYLHRDFDGYYSFAGCLFIGQGCDADSDSFVIYGHNMNNGSMFGQLDWYSDANYADEHCYIRFDTEHERRIYRVFAALRTQVYAEDEDVFKYYEAVGDLDEEGYNRIVSELYNLSLIDIVELPQYPSQIMMLSTCAYHTDEGRFVVAAYRVK